MIGMAFGKVCDRSVPGIGFGPASSYRLIIRGVVVDFVVVGFSSTAAADFLVFAVDVFVLFAVIINDDDNIGYSK